MLISRIKKHIEARGWHGLATVVASKAINHAAYMELLNLYRLGVDDIGKEFIPVPDGYILRQLSADEVRRFAENPASGLDGWDVAQAIQNGDRCFAMLKGTELAGYGWYSTYPTAVTDAFKVRFAPGAWYMHHGFTAPEHRGRRLHAIGMANALLELSRQGMSSLVSVVANTNLDSRKSVLRLGYRPVGSMLILGKFGRYVVYVGPGARSQGFWLEPRHRSVNVSYLGASEVFIAGQPPPQGTTRNESLVAGPLWVSPFSGSRGENADSSTEGAACGFHERGS